MHFGQTVTGVAVLVIAAIAQSIAYAADKTEAIAQEAVEVAVALPPGYKRDIVLHAVSRNLREFGQPVAGVRAARAMSDGGISELPQQTVDARPPSGPPREAMTMGSPCDLGLWRRRDGSVANMPKDREAWARACLLTRHFDWIGLPSVDRVREIASGLPAGRIKGAVLAMLLRGYGDVDTLRFVMGEVARKDFPLPKDSKAALQKMLGEPAFLYRLGRKDEVLASARKTENFASRAEIIRILVAAGDTDTAIAIFNLLASTPPNFGEDCFGWFGPIGGLELSSVGNALVAPAPALGAFIDRLPASALFRKVCPAGLNDDLFVEYLLAAGRFDDAIVRAREEKTQPFLLIDTLLQVGRTRLHSGDPNAARVLAEEAAAVLPPFDPGDPIEPTDPNRNASSMTDPATNGPERNQGERSGDTRRRFEVIQLLAATGAVTEAEALARKQPGALRAVALSAAVAGRAGLRFDDQAPLLSTISAADL